MECYTPQPNRRHNPVDSITRKLKTIEWRGGREPNTPFQIPKLCSSSYASPQFGRRHNLEAMLKKGVTPRDKGERGKDKVKGKGGSMQGSQRLPTPSTPVCTPSHATYSITSTRGERRGADGSDLSRVKAWQKYCSTPASQVKDSLYFDFTQGLESAPQGGAQSRSPPVSHSLTPSHSTLAYNLNFCSADAADAAELPYPVLVVKRLSMGDAGSPENKENMAEVSLICEENLLDTIFHACDTQRRGKAFVSHIVDYLRHTTSRSSEDRGLEELCNMLDPEQKDVSIDLDTYHAVMREWIDDCRNNGEEQSEDVTQESVKRGDSLSAKRSMLLNMTSGSLEGFGGDASRAEFETSELVYCVADLQMSNHKLEEEVRRLKQVVEGMEDSNQKLLEENEELGKQARVMQQLTQEEKLLKEEVEEMKASLSCTEEGRARASAHLKQVKRENQDLIAKIASLQEENFKVAMETDRLQRRVSDLCDINADLQVKIHSFDAVISDKDTVVQEKNRQINELKATVEEYFSITELLRADKSKLENQLQMLHPNLAGAGLSLSAAFRLNQSPAGSLQTELALAQSPLRLAPHGVDLLSTTMSVPSTLDETLDREVLLMLQGPSPEHMATEFRSLLHKLKLDSREVSSRAVGSLGGLLEELLEEHTQPGSSTRTHLQTVQADLDAKVEDWAVSLDQLAQYTDSLERELIKMASNMRRSRTEILHLSVRVQEQENQKRQLSEELEQLKTPPDSREASCQTPVQEEEPGDDLDWDEEFALQDFLKNELAERSCEDQGVVTTSRPEETEEKVTHRGVEDEGEEKWTVVDTTGEGDLRYTSTPLSAPPGDVPPVSDVGDGQESAACNISQPEATSTNSQTLQEDTAVLLSAHSAAVSVRHPEVAAPPDPDNNNNADVPETAESDASAPGQHLSSSPEKEQAEGSSPPTETTMVPTDSGSRSEETVTQISSTEPRSEDQGGEGNKEGSETSLEVMSRSKSLSPGKSVDRSATEDSACLLPVLLEEEESAVDGSAEAPAVTASMDETHQLTSTGTNAVTDGSPQPPAAFTHGGQSAMSTASVSSDPSQSEDGAVKDSLPSGGKNKRELEQSGNMEANEEHKVQEKPSESSVASEKEAETSGTSDKGDKDNRNSLSVNDKEIETEFQRLALGFKCDMFTLEKRVRLEERSRDLAEENVRREVSSCQGLLQALIPLCDDDNQSMEIIQRLQKNLDILIQSMTRVSSRSEMLGAIHQESRIGKAVEVMIQHVENLRRVYTKEHAELLELREALMQNERSFGSSMDRDEFRVKKQQTSQYYKSATRRVSIAAIPRSGGGGNMHFDMSKTQDGSEAEAERLTRRSPWNVTGKSSVRPPLKRYVSSAAWVDTEEPSLMMKGTACDNSGGQTEEEKKEEPVAERRRSSLSELGNKITSFILPLKTSQDELFVMLPSPSSSPASTDQGVAQSLSHSLTSSRAAAAAAVARGGRGLWLWVAMVVVLAGLLALLASLVMQPAVDAAPVGTGDSWMTIQQLLWPYAGLRHNGQPPV